MKIPKHLKKAELTLIFHLWKLHLTLFNAFSRQVLPSQSSIMVNSKSENKAHEKWKFLKIINCWKTRRKTEYKAIYIKSYKNWNVNSSWQSISDFEHFKNAILKFHKKNPTKSKPSARLIKLNTIMKKQVQSSKNDNFKKENDVKVVFNMIKNRTWKLRIKHNRSFNKRRMGYINPVHDVS